MRIVFTVTNDLNYDQRMQRICHSLVSNNFDVLLVGRRLKNSLPFSSSFAVKRLRCIFNKGILFYLEYNIRLFFFLLIQKTNAYCAIDLDTILPVYLASLIRNKKRVYDAHELFTEQKEIVSRKHIHRFWLAIERFAVPKFKDGYTVNLFIKHELKRRYKVDYTIIRNLPVLSQTNCISKKVDDSFIIYQGAVNEGRSFETLIPAMKAVNIPLHIFGKGNFFEQVKELINKNQVEDKVKLFGFVEPSKLKRITPTAAIAVTLFEKTGLNQFYSLSNRFFDYIMAGVPQICVNYPEYKAINDIYDIALMIDDTNESTISSAIQKLLSDKMLYERLHENCLKARKDLNWKEEEKKLIDFYKWLFKQK